MHSTLPRPQPHCTSLNAVQRGSIRALPLVLFITLLTACSTPEPAVPQQGNSTITNPGVIAPQNPIAAILNPAPPVAGTIEIGTHSCAVGRSVTIQNNPQDANSFLVFTHEMEVAAKKNRKVGLRPYKVQAVPTTTGALRFEDKASGVALLQLANKSMLLNQKAGKRIADDCQSEAQKKYAEYLAKNTGRKGLFD